MVPPIINCMDGTLPREEAEELARRWNHFEPEFKGMDREERNTFGTSDLFASLKFKHYFYREIFASNSKNANKSEVPFNMKDTIVVDLDGTLALDDHRKHHLRAEPKRWKDYFDACHGDELNFPVAVLVRAMAARGYRIEIVSGRCDSVRVQTVAWLNRHNLLWHSLLMRPEGNRTQDDILKLEVVKPFADRILFVLEDRQRVVDAWRKAGYTCLQVAPGDF